jgi:aryl-phospho-beta-D-glucosidase BglC (GH1 family)
VITVNKTVYTRRSLGLAAAGAMGGLLTGGAAPPPAPGGAVRSFLATSGAKIVDAATGEPFIIKAAHWFGMEFNLMPIMLGWRGSPDQPGRAWRTMTYTGRAQNGLTPNTVHEGVLDQMVRLGFNTVRLSICEDVTWPNAQVNGAAGTPGAGKTGIGGLLNPDLLTGAQRLSTYNYDYIPALAVLDKMVDYAGSIGLRVILDMHCLEPSLDNTAHHGLWYTTPRPGDQGTGPTHGAIGTQGDPRSEQQWLDAWAFLAKRYANTPAVCAFDLMNEPYAITWDNNPLRGWPAACERAAAVIQAVNPNVLLVCEGAFSAIRGRNGTDYTSYGEDLTGVRGRRIVTPVPNRVVYSPHDYSNATQPRFKTGFPGTLAPWWDAVWGYIAKEGIAPILVGEFSGDFRDPAALSDVVQSGKSYSAKASATRDGAWMQALSDYICANGLSWAYFSFANDVDHAATDTDVLLGLVEADGITPTPRAFAAIGAMLAR